MIEYVERGGLRWGQSFARAANVTWPFATIGISRERVRLIVKFWNILNTTFEFEKAELEAILRRRGLFSISAQFHHRKAEYPPFILFWTFREKTLVAELRRMGYDVMGSPR
jgi:hypothetical protein